MRILMQISLSLDAEEYKLRGEVGAEETAQYPGSYNGSHES
jgi:hypothetical protein